MALHKTTFFLISTILISSCANHSVGTKLTDVGNINEEDTHTAVNAIEQAKPQIMVIPSDNLLRRYNAISKTTINGVEYKKRNYELYLQANPSNKAIISAFQDEFVQLGYPLTDLEQTLKSISNKEATDMADGIAKDAKTLLLQKASPDIILELDYSLSIDNLDADLKKKMSYTITAFDSYNNKSLSSKSVSNVTGTTINEIMTKCLHKDLKSVSKEIKNYFGETIKFGREITVRFLVDKGARISLASECSTGDTYTDWIMDYMDLNTKKGTYKLQTNTDYELLFINVRIPVLREDGTQYSAYHWARECVKSLREDCGIKASNKVQGLGDVSIVVKGF